MVQINSVCLVCANNPHMCCRKLRPGLQGSFSLATSHGHVFRRVSLLAFLSLNHLLLAAWTQKEGWRVSSPKVSQEPHLENFEGLRCNSTYPPLAFPKTSWLLQTRQVNNLQTLQAPRKYLRKDFSRPKHRMLKTSNASCWTLPSQERVKRLA